MELIAEETTTREQGLSLLEQAQKSTIDLLSQFANSLNFQADLNLIFDDVDSTGIGNLVKQWSSGDFTSLPNVEILPSAVIDGALGAFSPDTGKIYLSQDYISSASSAAITNLLLHEIGHFVKTQVAKSNTGGEVGEIFATFALGKTLTPLELQTFKLENDTATIILDGQQITINKAAPSGIDFSTIQSDLDKALDTLQKAVNGQALGNSLPLLGDTLKNNPAAQFITKLQKAINDELAKLPNPAAPTADDIKQALNTAASKLGILKDLQEIDSADRVEYVLKLGEDIASVSTPLATDIGLPLLGLKVGGNADTKIGYDFKLGFGVDKTKGFFLDTAQDSLDLKLGVTTPNLSTDAGLGFLTFKAKDAGTKFDGDFAIDLKSASPDKLLFLSDVTAIGSNYQNLVDAKLKGDADVELNLGATTGVKGLPSVSTDLSVKWNFNGLSSADPTKPGSFGNAPAIAFNHVTVDAGSAISDFIGPVLKEVKDVTEPLQPIIDIINSPLPVINLSLIQLAETFGFGSPDTDRFIKQLSDVITLVNSIPTNGDEVKIDLGSFSFGGNDIRTTLASNIPGLSALGAAPANPLLTSSGVTAGFINQLQKLAPEDNGLKLDFPILSDPNTAISLLLGKSGVDLFTFQPPTLSDSFNKSYFVPILGPLGVEFGLKADVRAGIKIGYDSTGLSEFKASGDASKLFDGFYASRPNGVGINGNNVYLYGDLTAGAGVGIGIGSLIVGGGISLTTVFNLDGIDGKVRPSDFASKPIFQLFNPSGGLDAILFGQLRLDFGFFSFNERLDLADERLIDFSASNTSPNELDHYRLENNSDALITTSDKSEIIKRVGTTGKDNIVVTHTGDGAKGENLRVTGLDPLPKDYADVKLIVIKGREGDDTIDLSDVRNTPGQISGDAGNDTIIGGGGDDFLMGGAGNNFLDGGGGKNNTVDYSAAATDVFVNLGTGGVSKNGYGGVDTLANIQNAVGSRYNDTLIAGDADAVLQGGDGDDTLVGGKGDDVLMGGNGENSLDGGDGTNTVSYLFAIGPVNVNLSSQNVGSSTRIISPIDGSILYEAANTAVGGYRVINDSIKNIQNLQGSTYDDILVAGNNAPSGTTYKSKNSFTYTGSYIDGSQGNDLIYAGLGSDVLDGGQGINWLSYALSTAAVQVDLTPGTTQSGGYAAGDKILAIKTEYTDNKGTDTNLSSFQNLEGSAHNDTLRGDIKDNTIRGGAGNDTIYGGDGNDLLMGGAGADYLSGDGYTGTLRADLDSASIASGNPGGGNTASYADSSGAVTVNLLTHSGQRSDAEGDQLFGIQNLIGSARGDIFFGGNEFSNDFNPGLSGGGTDIVVGGTGHTNSLTVDYSLGDYGAGATGGFTGSRAGSITRSSSDGKTVLDAMSFANIDRLFFTGTIQDDNITGGFNAKGDVIFTGAGNDTVNGGGGNDYLDGGDGIDTLSDYLGDRTKSITLTGIDPSDPNAKQINGTNFVDSSVTIQNFEVFKDITTGSGSSDRIVQPGRVNNNFIKAGSGSNYVDPGIGFDTVDGGLGGLFATRTLHVDYSQGDTGNGMMFSPVFGENKVPLRSGDGSRKPISNNDPFNPFIFQDRIDFKNFDQYEITGTSKIDSITGGDGNDILSGGSGGNDKLVGGRGNDTLIASSGGSKLQGTDNFDRGSNQETPNSGPFGGVNTTHTYNLAQDQDTLYGGTGADTFVLGDESTDTNSINNGIAPGGIFYAHSFYDGSNIDNDYANIVNFDPSRGDVIQLRKLDGYAAKYTLINFGREELLFLGYTDKNEQSQLDYMANITGNFGSLDLKSSAFSYVGDAYTNPNQVK